MYCFFGVPIGSDLGPRSLKREPLANPAGEPKAGEPSLADGRQTALVLGEERPAHWLSAAVARFWATASLTPSQLGQEVYASNSKTVSVSPGNSSGLNILFSN
jgi:hypothetical protein